MFIGASALTSLTMVAYFWGLTLAKSSRAISNLAGTACSGESLSLMANLTGEGATGQARVWMKALGVLPGTCDLDIVPPQDSGVVLFFLDAYLRPPVEQGGCLDSLAVFAPTVNGSFSEERLLATCVTGDLVEKVVVSQRPGATVRVELSIGTRDEESVWFRVAGPDPGGAQRQGGGGIPCSGGVAGGPAPSLGLEHGAVGIVPVGLGKDSDETRRSSGDVCVPADAITGRAGDRSQCEAQDEFRCKDSNCVWTKFLCDGTPNCPDGSDEFAYSYSRCRHSLHYGLEMVGFFGAVGGIILVLLALDSFVRYLLEIWRLRQKQTWRTAVRRPTRTASETEYLTTARATGSKAVNPLDRDLALFEEENGPDPSSRANQLDDAGEGSVRSEAPPCATARRLTFSRKSSSKKPPSSRVFGASKNSLTPPLGYDATSKVYGGAERRDADNIFPMGSDIDFAKQTQEEPSEYPRFLLDDLDEGSPDGNVSVEDAYMSWDLAGSYKDLSEDSLASESFARFSTRDDDSGVQVRAARPVLSRQLSKGEDVAAHLLALKRSRKFTEGDNTISEGVLQWAYSSEERSSPGPSFSTGRSQDVEVIGFRDRWGKKALAALQRKRRMRNARQEL
ncbi:hypothetical protein HPB47_020569 [Ixodes persulcatus]|uniref:Uncharacterized protein n=1 Tax=Ixodes persulcatus TaxID=34615 RepID=A0AC60QFV8_IXOPE|nr:hypothetical protein HPB47_020569 [Ixodes persulcatus]